MKLFIIVLLSFATSCGRVRNGAMGPSGNTGATGSQGEQGLPGIDGTDASIEVIDLCPDIAGNFPQVLFRIDEKLFTVYRSNGNNTRLVELVPGNYVTTDGRSCNFTVTNDLEVEY